MSLDARQAVECAFDQATSLLPLMKQEIQLEELEMSEDGREWLVTLGWSTGRTIKRTAGPTALFDQEIIPERAYKIFHIDADTGTLRKMRIREV